jgi:hypothetical protein
MANGKPLATPGAPTVVAENGELSVSWTAAVGADEYEVYYGIGTPSTLAATVSGTSTTITGLTNGTTYSVMIRGKNSTGSGGSSTAVNGKPTAGPILYDGSINVSNKLGTFSNLAVVFTYLSTNTVTGHNYYIVLGQNESANPISLGYSGQTVGITIIGDTAERTITLAANGSLFTVNTGVTLTLDNNITLMGRTNNASLVTVSTGGTLVMKDGAKITGNFGGGVYVAGTFNMTGGNISNNIADGDGGGVYVNNSPAGGSSTFRMYGGEINGNTANREGGGVYVNRYNTFSMYGGTISGNTATYGGGVYVMGGFTKAAATGCSVSSNTTSPNTASCGPQVYVARGEYRSSDAGETVALNSAIAGSTGGWGQ